MVITTSTNLVLSLNGIECAEMMARALLEIRKQKKILELCQQRMQTEGDEGAVLCSREVANFFGTVVITSPLWTQGQGGSGRDQRKEREEQMWMWWRYMMIWMI